MPAKAAAIARRDYERGILDQLTVLDAQRQSNRADMLLAQGQVQLVVNTVTLYKALGGGWEIAEPAPATQPASRSTTSKEMCHESINNPKRACMIYSASTSLPRGSCTC